MFQFDDFVVEERSAGFDADALLKQAMLTLSDGSDWEPVAIAKLFCLDPLDACRFIANFAEGNGVGNPIHLVKIKGGSLVSSRWRFHIGPANELSMPSDELNAATCGCGSQNGNA